MIRKPPRYANLNKGHNLAEGLHTCLTLNEHFGTKVWDHAGRKNYNFNSTNPPAWNAEGVEFIDYQESIDWIPTDTLPPIGTMIFGFRYLATPVSYWFFVCSSGGFGSFSINDYSLTDELGFWVNEAIQVSSQNLSAGWADGNDHQFVFQWDSINNYAAIYYDGILNNEATPSFSMSSSSQVIGIGARPDDGARNAGGIFPYFYVYNKLLTAPEIMGLWKNPYAMFGHKISKFSFVEAAGGCIIMPIFPKEGVHSKICT